MISSFSSKGMVTISHNNPLDEIPIGNQIFPYDTPTIEESQVGPYQTTDYLKGVSSRVIQFSEAYPTSNYQIKSLNNTAGYQTTETYPLTNYKSPIITNEYKTNSAYPLTNKIVKTSTSQETYDLGNYKLPDNEIKQRDYTIVNVPTLSTTYKTVASYKPASRTIYTPRISTTYLSVPVTTPVDTTPINPPIPSPSPIVHQSLSSSQIVPLPAPVMAPLQPLAPQQYPKPIQVSILIQDDSHYVSNYPIYENDPRKSEFISRRNQSIIDSLNLCNSIIITSAYPNN